MIPVNGRLHQVMGNCTLHPCDNIVEYHSSNMCGQPGTASPPTMCWLSPLIRNEQRARPRQTREERNSGTKWPNY